MAATVRKPTPEQPYRPPQYLRLTIARRPKSRFYQARTFLDGKLETTSLKTEHLGMAETKAIDWYKKLLRASVTETKRHPIDKLGTIPTVAELFRNYKAELPALQRPYADMKWSTIAPFWQTIEVTAVGPQTFKDFYKWRRKGKTRLGTAVKSHPT